MMKPKTKAGKQAKVGKVMHEFKTGTLHSGKGGPVVKSQKQAVAIAMSEAGMAKKKTNKKK
jgi:ribosomal protein L21E